MEVAYKYLSDTREKTQEDGLRILLQRCVVNTEMAFEAFGAPAGSGGFQEALAEYSNKHIKSIYECWYSVRDSIQPYS